MANPNRWNDGPTLSIREGESVREATLRVLDAPRPPVLHPERAAERPEQQRQRYLDSSRRDVSDPDLWDFLHGAQGEAESSTYEEAVESEKTSDGDFSLVTDHEDGHGEHQPAPGHGEEDLRET